MIFSRVIFVVFLFLASALGAAEPPPSNGAIAKVPVTFTMAGSRPAEPLRGMLEAKSLGLNVSAADTVTADIVAPGEAVLELRPRTAWRLTADVPGLWAPPQIVTPPIGDGVRVVLRPTGQLAGSIKLLGNEAPPSELSLRFQTPPGVPAANAIAEASVTCPIVEKRFICTLPAAPQLDLRLGVKGFVSHFFWDVPVTPAGKRDVGLLTLQRGASLAGQVVTAEGPALPQKCRVEISPAQAVTDHSEASQERLRRLALSASITERGFFHFEGIPPGAYVVTAEQPGFAPARLHPVTVLEKAETELREPLQLERPLTLEVKVVPPVDPLGQPWNLELMEQSTVPGSLRELAKVAVPENGVYRRPGLAPGGYLLLLNDQSGARMGLQELQFDAATTTVLFELPVVWVEGVVRLGDEPVSADVYFGGQWGNPEKIVMAADEAGEFTGYLPREGDWPIYVEVEAPPIRRNLPKREVRQRKGARAAQVEIELPDTELSGVTVDENGEPIANALVSLYEEDVALPNTTLTDPDGRFSYLGLAEGRSRIAASSVEKSSDQVEVEIHEEVAGRVLAPGGGGVPAAQVWAQLFRADDGIPLQQLQQATTTVFPPGYTLIVRPPMAIDEGPLLLEAQSEGGSLTLEQDEPIVWGHDGVHIASIDGMPLPFFLLGRWGAVNGSPNADPTRYTIPQLPPGSYAICTLLGRYGPTSAEPTGKCARGFLAPLSELTLRLP
jgi:hypothetical protein